MSKRKSRKENHRAVVRHYRRISRPSTVEEKSEPIYFGYIPTIVKPSPFCVSMMRWYHAMFQLNGNTSWAEETNGKRINSSLIKWIWEPRQRFFEVFLFCLSLSLFLFFSPFLSIARSHFSPSFSSVIIRFRSSFDLRAEKFGRN